MLGSVGAVIASWNAILRSGSPSSAGSVMRASAGSIAERVEATLGHARTHPMGRPIHSATRSLRSRPHRLSRNGPTVARTNAFWTVLKLVSL